MSEDSRRKPPPVADWAFPPRDAVKTVTDAATLRAIAHPLRTRLLGSLRIDGPATASELGRRFSESSGTTSYHLRILHKHGFIEPDPDQPNARDKRWRAAHMYTSWNNDEVDADPAAAEAARFMRRRQLDNVIAATEGFEQEKSHWGAAWVRAAGHADHTAHLTPASVQELNDRVSALVGELAERDAGADDTATVRVYLAAFPVEEARA